MMVTLKREEVEPSKATGLMCRTSSVSSYSDGPEYNLEIPKHLLLKVVQDEQPLIQVQDDDEVQELVNESDDEQGSILSPEREYNSDHIVGKISPWRG